ncbi:MAG TPA: four helix bundle protein [Vitreimonas sp.]|uniref:four helix bundle protein n=1 Tax=Vitreimonas sp. TaxID=3069702 RepID=UPI002D2C8775|nr:four helix bundle protein [Vitreimonas sp.]HYD87626.1 four helix bundle protein [Vitreimonas sp.]
MTALRSYRELAVWEKSMTLARSVYTAAEMMPKKEEYRLTSQMIRAAISIPANIAEGHARATRKDYAHFVSISRGSTAELETLILLTQQCELLPDRTVEELHASAEEVGRMLRRLHERLKQAPEN